MSKPKQAITSNSDDKVRDIASQAKKTPDVESRFKDLPDIEYDVKTFKHFMGMVFHSLGEDAFDNHILTWFTPKGAPAYPITIETMEKKLTRSNTPAALYFGTSSCGLDLKDQRLYNRKDLFRQLHVVVLDDIGTKIPLDTLPKDLEPTYIIESSEGNYQYGFVLEDPVNDLAAAEALIQLVYSSGFSDAGGKMPTKLVRLPLGVNGKTGPKQGFPVRLTKDDGPYWTPQALLDALKVNIRWSDVLEDAEKVGRRMAKTAGTTPWSPIKSVASSLDGVVDPVLEWLYEQGMVKQETGLWATITCPWHDQHTSGGDTAGYAPLGRGSKNEDHAKRGFKCFHDHCKDKDTRRFLEWVQQNGGPVAGVFDPAAGMVAEWIFDTRTDAAWRIRGVNQPYQVSMAAFKNQFARSVGIPQGDGKLKQIPEYKLWMTSAARVIVHGQTYFPGKDEALVEGADTLQVNTYAPPQWGDGDIVDQKDIDTFLDFVTYLVPKKAEREYFLDWLACKAQDMAFRGNAILMVAKSQGTGRGTLSDMLSMLFMMNNCENIKFKDMIGSNNYNEWLEKPLVMCHEIKDTGEGVNQYQAYEAIKDLVDPRPRLERLNPKYGKQREAIVYSSHLMFTNHGNALAIPKEDRRFFVAKNPSTPADADYFEKINDWMNTLDDDRRPIWCKSVWRWLRNRDVSPAKMAKPAPVTDAKKDMVYTTGTAIQSVVECIVDNWHDAFVGLPVICEFIEANFAIELELASNEKWKKQVGRVIQGMSEALHDKARKRVRGYSPRPRVLIRYLTQEPGIEARFIDRKPNDNDLERLGHSMDLPQDEKDLERLKQVCKDALDEYSS